MTYEDWQKGNQQMVDDFDLWQAENQLFLSEKTGFIKGLFEKPEKFLPVAGQLLEAEQDFSILGAARRLETAKTDSTFYEKLTPEKVKWGMVPSRQKFEQIRAGGGWITGAGQPEWTPESQKQHDIKLVENWVAEQEKEYTWGGRVGQIVGEMPAFGAEMAITAGVFQAPKAAVTKLLGKGVKGKLAGWTIGSVLQAQAMPHRMVESFAKRRLPETISADEKGQLEFTWPDESPYTSFAKAWGDIVIEVASEQSGQLLGDATKWVTKGALEKLPFGQKFIGKLFSAYQRIHPKTEWAEFIRKISTKVGYHGVVGEIGEEFVGDTMRAIANVDDFGAGPEANIVQRLGAALNQDVKNLPTMAAAFIVPGITRAAFIHGAGQFKAGMAARAREEPVQRPEAVGPVQRIAPEPTIGPEGPSYEEIERTEKKIEPRILEQIKTYATEKQLSPEDYLKELHKAVQEYPRNKARKEYILGHTIPKQLGWTEEQRKEFMRKVTGGVAAPIAEFGLKWGTGRTKNINSAPATPEFLDWYNRTDKTEIRQKGYRLFKNWYGEWIVGKIKGKHPEYGIKPVEEIEGGKDSMKKMTPEERIVYIEALKEEAKKQKIDITDPKVQAIELIETIQQTKKLPTETGLEKLNEGGIKKLERQIRSMGELIYENYIRIERFLEGLDGHYEGAHIENIWKPIKNADEFAIENENRRIEEFRKYIEDQNIDIAVWMGKVDHIADKIDLTASQRIGIYTLSQNKDGLRHLQQGYGLTDEAIKSIVNFMSPQEKIVGDWLLQEYESQWPILQTAAIQAGISPKALKQEYRYTPLILRDVDVERQIDFLSDLTSAFVPEATLPPKGMLIERSKHAGQPVELDAFLLYMHNIHRVERFNTMAPVVSKVGKLLNNREYRQTLNAVTYGYGSKILHTWLRDASRGHGPAATTLIEKMFRILRKNGIVYAIGYNIPSSLRQTISLSNAFAVDPAMWKYGLGNTLKAMTPEGYRELQNYCYEKSLELKTRDYDRDLRRTWNRSELSKRLRGKDPFSRKATAWIRWMDRHTCVVAWKSLYDVATGKGMSDEAAIVWADKWLARTQPMANAKDLPQFFRGGTIERVLSTFQNQVNNNGNFYLYDIIEAKMAGEINWDLVGYRVMMSYILPAILFGMIGRARLPEDWEDIAVDLVTYPVATFFLIGRYMDRVVRGWGQSELIAEMPLEEAVKFGRAIEKGDWTGILKHGAANVGIALIAAEKPGPTAQMIRTGQGLYDLYAGKTNDPRRLIYSKWALEQGKKKDVGIHRRKRRKPRERRTR